MKPFCSSALCCAGLFLTLPSSAADGLGNPNPAVPNPVATVTATIATNVTTIRRVQVPNIISPEVLSDRRVTFRVRATNANEVTISGEWTNGVKQLTKDAAGIWSVTLGPLEPDIYGYSFSIDGFQTLDPANPA